MVNRVLTGFVNVTVIRRLLLLELICVDFIPEVVDVIGKNKENFQRDRLALIRYIINIGEMLKYVVISGISQRNILES